jgi:protein O-mannosyl-transferase
MHKHHRYLLIVALPLFFFVTLALHYPALHAPMYIDSVYQLESKEHIFASGDLFKVLQIASPRPVAMTSFYVNYLIWGMNPFYFRIVNAVIFALTALVATVAFILILELAGPSESANATRNQIVGLFLGLIFLVHPIQTYFVDYIWQRVGLLCCFFYISALAVYLAVRTGRIPYKVAGYALCMVLFCLALASKEKAVTLPGALVLAEIAFFWDGRKSLFKRVGVFVLILLPLVAVLSLVERPHAVGGEALGILDTIAKYYEESGLTLSQAVISQCRVLFTYLALIVAPVPSNVQLSTAHMIFSSPLESAAIAASVLGAIAILAAGIVLIRKRPLTGFGLLFFLVNLAPESFLVPKYLFFAYRANLPMFGLLLIFGDVLLALWARAGTLTQRKWYFAAAAAGLLAVMVIVPLSAVTISKSKLWQDPVAFWKDIVDTLPPYKGNVEKRITVDALDGLGVALERQAKNAEAITLFRRALEIDYLYIPSYVNLAATYMALGDTAEAEASLKKAVDIDPKSAPAQFALGEFYVIQEKLSAAWVHMRRAADLTPSDPRCLNGLGKVLLGKGNASEAASYFRNAITMSPGFHEAHYNLGEAHVSMGMDNEAARHFSRALELKSSNWQAHNSLGLLLTRSGNLKEAEAHFREALMLSPRNWRIHNNLAVLLAKSGHFPEAADHFEKALSHNPVDVSARKNLERVRALMGSPSVK